MSAALWYLFLAVRWQPGFDEWWHIWFGEIDAWRLFQREIAYDTHPPTLSLLVRILSAPGDSPLWARSAAIVPAVATVPLFWSLCRQLEMTVGVALLSTAVFAFSHTFASVAISLRSYALANLFLTAALVALAGILRDPTRPAPGRLWAGVLGILAAAGTLYVAVLPGLFALAFVLWRWHSTNCGGRRAGWLHRPGPWVVLAVGLAAVLAFYLKTCHVPVASFIGEHVRPPDGDALSFALGGFNANVALFTPFAPPRESWLPPVLALVLAGALIASSVRAGRWGRVMVLAAVPFLVGCLGTAGVLRAYPWGGNARHQFLLFVPTLLGAMFLVDAAYRRAGRRARGPLIALVALAAALVSQRSYAGPHLDDFRAGPLWDSDYAALAQRVRDGDVVIAPRYAQIGLYARARDESGWRWLGTTKRDGLHFDRFAAKVGGKEVTVVLDHPPYCLPKEPDAAWARSIARVVEANGTRTAWLFAQTPFAAQELPPRSPGLGARAAAALAATPLRVTPAAEFGGGALLQLALP